MGPGLESEEQPKRDDEPLITLLKKAWNSPNIGLAQSEIDSALTPSR